ncbi:MAG TPA: multidrug transporter AcrB [Elusimicrobia bacterium]|nr:multidrug transporter AcrB [Elusimicrobiota bacterium]
MNQTHHETHLGAAGNLAETFIRSKLTLLIVLGSLLVGAFATLGLPREEEPQINVPMFDILVPFPGASAREVEERVVQVGERRLWEIPGVEYLYTTAEPGFALFIVRFKVGTDPETATTLVHAKTQANLDLMSPGAGHPLIKARSIDDVPILTLTLWGADPYTLRRAAATLREEVSAVPDVSEIQLIGGRRRTLHVRFDPDKLRARRLSPLELAGLLRSANRRLPAGHYNAGGEAVRVETDAFIRSADELKRIVVGVSDGRPVQLSEVAVVEDGPDDAEGEVVTALAGVEGVQAAATLAVSKRRGANATSVSREVLARVKKAEGRLLPPEVQVSVTRDYGETAKAKSDELLFHMLLATLSVTLLIALALGLREALVVLVAIPVTLALTMMVYYLFGYTLNRITLFALIFSIGILVDDAIVVVENIHRHYMMSDERSLWRLSVDAVAEVGNPTLLATWAVIAAILPMAFVRGLMGPYMRPIPVGASMAMLFSLAIAFIVTPWAFAHLLEWWPLKRSAHGHEESALDRLYRRVMGRLLDDGLARGLYLGAMAALLLASLALVAFKKVTVKMLPFDNKNEFEVILNLPEGSSIDRTRQAAGELLELLRKVPEAVQVSAYVGTAAPYNFNGLVRHYYLRNQPYQAALVVNLKDRHDRKRQSHAIASALRAPIRDIARRYGARVQVAEVPPGPPVLSTLVLELYGPDEAKRLELARKVRALLERTEGIVDVDTYVPDPQRLERLVVDRPKATLNAIPASDVAQTVALALDGQAVDIAHLDEEREPVEIRLRLGPEHRRDLSGVRRIALLSRGGTPISIGELTRSLKRERDLPVFRKNLLRVSYVIADVAGRQESPVYGILALRPEIQKLAQESGVELHEHFASQPKSSQEFALKWDGEWHITYEVFRDLGLAFALVLVLIYVLVVGWFRSFAVPFVIMAPIPLTLVGILPAHWAMGAFFTATSMIGFIAGAGIVVRNSIILVDFIGLRLKEGMPLREAVIDAGAVRFRPMLLTAAAVVAGAGVILFDPIFQGLAVALMAGEVASTLLSRMAVPILYYLLAKRVHLEV